MDEKEIVSVVKGMVSRQNKNETCIVSLSHSTGKHWAIVFGWLDDFDEAYDDDGYKDGKYRICGKVAYNNSYGKEYAYDWKFPTDKDGNVYDTECSLDDFASLGPAIAWWDTCWEDIKNMEDIICHQ